MKKNALVILACLVTSVLFFSACEKTNYEVVSHFNVRMGATAYNAAKVNVQIQQVKVNYEDTTWVDLNTTGTNFNLLDYQNTDTLVASNPLPATVIVKQIKLIFGQQATIKTDGKDLPAMLTGNREVVLDVYKKLNRNVETIKINFNTAQSIQTDINGGLVFRPVVDISK